MSLFKRIKNIIRSNINYQSNVDSICENNEDINVNDYDDTYYNDVKDIPDDNKKEKEYYSILELEYGSGFEEIKKAYKKMLKKYHPDMYHNKPEKLKAAQKVTEKINEAYTYFERKYR